MELALKYLLADTFKIAFQKIHGELAVKETLMRNFQPNLVSYYTYLQNKRMRWCVVAPPPIIFERLKLPQQIIYRRKENLSESPNHQKYWENILVSRFYDNFREIGRI